MSSEEETTLYPPTDIPRFVGGESCCASLFELYHQTPAMRQDLLQQLHEEEQPINHLHLQQQQQQNGCSNCRRRRSSLLSYDSAAFLEQQHSHNERRSSWAWEACALQAVPLYHPLERTCLRLQGLPVSTISARISDFMRLNSITCVYYSCRVDCLTENLLKFVVQLWQNKQHDDDANDNDKECDILLEVQRRQGCAITMQRLRKQLYHFVSGEQSNVKLPGDDYPRRPSHVEEEEQLRIKKKQQEQQEYDADADADTDQPISETENSTASADDFNLCLDLLENDQIDQNRLGLECLISLADPSESSQSDVTEVSRALVLKDRPHGPRLQSLIQHYFCNIDRIEPATFVGSESCFDLDDQTASQEYIQGCHFGSMHRLALKFLSNALDSMASHEEDYLCNETTMLMEGCCDDSFWCSVLEALLYNLEIAHHRPQEAAVSVKCIRQLSTFVEPSLEQSVIEQTLLPLVRKAFEYGKAHHLALEQESRDLITFLELWLSSKSSSLQSKSN